MTLKTLNDIEVKKVGIVIKETLTKISIKWAKDNLFEYPEKEFTKGYNKGIIKMLELLDITLEDLK